MKLTDVSGLDNCHNIKTYVQYVRGTIGSACYVHVK